MRKPLKLSAGSGAVEIEVFRNSDVKRVIVAVPRGHKHYRIVLETMNGRIMVFQEATVANMVRAFITVLTHPERRAVELVQRKVESGKEGYAEYQLVETCKEDDKVVEELSRMLGEKISS